MTMKKLLWFNIILMMILLGLFIYQNDNYKELKTEYDKSKDFDDADLLVFLEDEDDYTGYEQLENKINLEKRLIKENEELLELLFVDIDRLKDKNINLEKKLDEYTVKVDNILKDEITYNQFPKYPTGCESVALYILLKYNKVNVNVLDIVNNLKKGELPYTVGGVTYGGNPEKEFIGDPKTNYSYGAFNGPLKDVANMFKPGIVSKKGWDFKNVTDLLDRNIPVMAWVTINLSKPYISRTWIYKETGEEIKWISGEHAVVIIGYEENSVVVSDPYTGTIRNFDKNLFIERYNYLGKRVLYYEK